MPKACGDFTGRPKALVFELPGYTRAHTRQSLVILGDITPRRVPLVIGKRSWPAGTRFWTLGSKNTCAAYETQNYRAFAPMEYVGMFAGQGDDGDLACFRQGEHPVGGYFAWHATEFGLMWGTEVCSGRIIAMDNVELCKARRAA